MAKRKSEVSASALRRHLELFGGEWRYTAWCRRNGLRDALDKTSREISAELALYQRQQDRITAQAKLHRNPKKLIEGICLGQLSSADIDRPIWKALAYKIERTPRDQPARESLLNLLLRVEKQADFLLEDAGLGDGTSSPYIDALCRLNGHRNLWRRTVDSWKPATHNARGQFASLVRHLVTDYPVPLFMDQAWFRSGKNAGLFREWYLHIGAGKNIRTARMAVPLTKLIAHHMMLAPDDYAIESAVKWGQIHALGGDRGLTEAVVGSRIGKSFSNNEFWLTVFRFLIANPMYDRHQVGPLVDFLCAQKFDPQDVIDENGHVGVGPPPHPNLSMRGRTPESLLSQIEKWHRELGRVSNAPPQNFPKSGFRPIEIKAGRDGANTWKISELLSTAELQKEGKAMHHCVASYARSCAKGDCSIWSMQFETPMGIETRQTVEVSRSGQIVQSRGKYNRLPTSGEFVILERWAASAGLRIAPHVRAEA